MSRIKIFLLCLALLGLAGMLHHQWYIATPASAADLSNGSGQSCAGTGLFHFVNNQTQGQCGPLTATFNCNGTQESFTVNPSACHNTTDQYFVSTPAGCTLVTATTGAQPGRLVLSDFACAVPAPSPSPSPAPSPGG